MFPLEISLPPSSVIYEPDLSESKEITQDDIVQNLIDQGIEKIISKHKTLVIINDHHRATPSYKILKTLSDIAPNHKIDQILIATGSHEEPSKKQLKSLLRGSDTKLGCKVSIHDAYSNNHVHLGRTSRGTDVWVNRIILEYDHILTINSVEPHYFAGFTGGIKSLVPGVAARSTIEQNHSWAMVAPGPARIDGELLKDLWEAGGLIPAQKISVQLVCIQDRIVGITSGLLLEAFHRAVELSMKLFSKTLEQQVDVIVSIIYPPLDKNLYQAQKGIENTRQALVKNGEMILVASCQDGIGNDRFYQTLTRYKEPNEVLTSLNKENYQFGDHKAYKFASLADNHKLTLVGNLTENECKTVFASYLPPKLLEDYIRKLDEEGKSIVIALDTGSLVLQL
ncbi:MAG: lactate racemase domain-containing protein [Candidatus Kariarchaeaceae archaeon]